MKYAQLNSDVFTGIVVADWIQMTEEFRQYKKVAGVTEASLYESALTLRHFERLVGRCNSKQITQDVFDKFILERGKEVKRSTLNTAIPQLCVVGCVFFVLLVCITGFMVILWFRDNLCHFRRCNYRLFC